MPKKTNPRILFITRKFPPSVGGMEKYAADLYVSLGQKTEVELVNWGGSNLLLPFVAIYFFFKSCWLLMAKPIDVIHMQDGVLAPLAIVLKTLFHRPVCVVTHGLDVTYRGWPYQPLIKWSLAHADKIICNSTATQEQVTKRGIEKSKTIVIPIGITDDIYMNDRKKAREAINKELGLEENRKLLLSVGRLVERKGVHWFIQNILPVLINKDQDIVLLISGDGEAKSLIRAAIDKTGLDKHVRLLGRTSDKLRQNLYNGCDVFVIPNIKVQGDMEGFGIVLLEASLCELPIVAAGIEGIKDAIVDGKNGILVDSKNVSSTSSAIQKFIDNDKYARSFGKSSRKYTLVNYGWPTIAQKFLAVYDEVVNKAN